MAETRMMKTVGSSNSSSIVRTISSTPKITSHLKYVKQEDPNCGIDAPVYGRYGSFFPNKNRLHKKNPPPLSSIKAHALMNRETGAGHQETSMSSSTFTGPYNLMWDPKVYRGNTSVHFATLERKCNILSLPVLKRQQRQRKKRQEMKSSHPMFGIKGTINYPHEPTHTFQQHELMDFSKFLEEQDAKGDSFKNIETQTDNEECRNVLDTSTDINCSMGKLENNKSMLKHSFQTGCTVSTQADHFHISKDMRFQTNPRQHVMNDLSKILSKQLLSQSILEEMESSELKLIRGQCEEIELWLARNRLRKEKEKRALCKKVQRLKLEEELEAMWEEQMEETKTRVAIGVMAQQLMKSLVANSFTNLRKEGLLLGADEGGSGFQFKEWLNKYAAHVFIHNKEVARNILDDIINDANSQRVIQKSEDFEVANDNSINEQNELVEEETLKSEEDEEEELQATEETHHAEDDTITETSPPIVDLMSPKTNFENTDD